MAASEERQDLLEFHRQMNERDGLDWLHHNLFTGGYDVCPVCQKILGGERSRC